MHADSPASFPTAPGDAPGPRPITGEDLQTRPRLEPPPMPPAYQDSPPDALNGVRRPPTAVKLRILRRCHDVAARARRLQTLAQVGRVTAVVVLGLALGGLAGLGVFGAVYDNPERYAQSYFDGYTTTFFVKGETVSQQKYDYFLATNSNLTTAIAAAVAVGLAVLAVFTGSLWLRGRKSAPLAGAGGVDEQIAAIVRDHPEAVREWGGPSVLREPELVAEILRIEERGSR